jgi:ribosome-associated protein
MDGEAPVSKTQRKRQVHELQALGAALVSLKDTQLSAIAMPERLREAVEEARRIRSFEARRRQFQYIGKLMRGLDPAPIRAALDALRAGADEDTTLFKAAERWRERLLAEPDALAELIAAHPRAHAARLGSLIRQARDERAAEHPPRSYRALFQALRSLLRESRD